jgi:predicted TIM-barrel fold metal-dependent hydrolase
VSAGADAAVSDCVVRMIAAGLFDRYPGLQFVIRSSGGGIPLLLNKLYWKHNGPAGEQKYSEILLQHFSVDCASSSPRTFQFLIDTMGDRRVVFGSDYCGGLGPLEKAMPVIDDQPDPWALRSLTERNSRALLHI